jgi:Septum formation initiator.
MDYRRGDKRLTYDTTYRSGDGDTVKVYSFDGVRSNMSSGGSAAVRGYTGTVAGRQVSDSARYIDGYAKSGFAGGVSRGAYERTRTGADRTRTGEYTGERSASGELRRRRTVSRTPDMSNPQARREAPSVSLGAVGRVSAQIKAKVKAAEPRIHTIPQTERKPFPVAFIFTTLLCSFLFMYMIYNIVRINEYTIDVSALKDQLSTLTTTQTELTLKLEKKNDLVEIERIATQEYGMVKRDKVTKQYVNVGDGDVIEAEKNTADDKSAAGGLSSLMSAISSNFGDYIK